MRMHFLEHVPFEGPAGFIPWLEERGHVRSRTALFSGTDLPDADAFDWLIVMGGPMSVSDEALHPWLRAEKRFIAEAIERGAIVTGICLGAQLIAEVLGARVYKGEHREIGWHPVTRTPGSDASPLMGGLPREFMAFHWHGDTFDLPPGCVHLAQSDACVNQAFSLEDRVLGLQFHLESTPESVERLIEHCADELVPGQYVQEAEELRRGLVNAPALADTFRTIMDALTARSG